MLGGGQGQIALGEAGGVSLGVAQEFIGYAHARTLNPIQLIGIAILEPVRVVVGEHGVHGAGLRLGL
ncbi:hypothetical protein GCM10020218_091180 [Dactylosporangium vinaceum]